MNTQKIFSSPLFNLGFRVFFALASLSALLLILLWNAMFKGSLSPTNYFSPNEWHAHEMLLGYSVAVIAGFLLTAVKNWTGQATATGDKLAGLGLLWLYGRIVPFYAGLLPDVMIAAVDFAFLPVLAYQVSQPILRTKNYRNLQFIGILLVLAFANGLIHADKLGLLDYGVTTGLQLVVATIIVLILIIAGRVFPFFTERGLTGVLIIRKPVIEHISIGSATVVFISQLLDHSGFFLVVPAIVATLSNSARVASWYNRKIWYVPLLWVLYVGYGWIILGFFFIALSAYQLVSPALALHAFTLGGIGVLTLGMMARVSLGHTGRMLKASNAIALAFALLNLAAVFRVLLPMALPNWYNGLVYFATLAWLAAFALFVFVYAPMLTSERVDGVDG
jgi:uncharacterized protein involved in response to NO